MKIHSPSELERASDYLELIIHMVEDDMRNLLARPDPSFERNVYIDSILIRLRSLTDFLCAADTSRDTDVIARHFIPGFALKGDDCTWLREAKKTVDTALAHLTTVPIPKLISQVEFPYPEMYRRVMRGLKLFFDADPPNVLPQTKARFASAWGLLYLLGDTAAP